MEGKTLLSLHFTESQDTSEESICPILVQQTYMSERDFGHIKLYQVTKDDALASMK